jgi:hypothetical protein
MLGKDYVKIFDHYHPKTTSLCDDITQLYRTGVMLASSQE